MTCLLEGPNDRAWYANLKQVDDNVILEKGWENFARDNSLEFGDFLMFSYNGLSKFKVTIYGRNCCIKEVKVTESQGKGKKQDSHVNLIPEDQFVRVKVEEDEEEKLVESATKDNVNPFRKRKRCTSDSRLVSGKQKAKKRKF